MGYEATAESGGYVGQLATHARKLQGEARAALAAGDYARAAALIGDAELLAADVHDMVDTLEERQTGTLMSLAAQAQAEARTLRRRGTWLALPPRRVRIALGTSIAMSLALTEC